MVFEMLRDMIVEMMGCDESDVTPDAELREELGMSEGELSELLEAMASELGFRVEDIDPDAATTARELVLGISALL